MAEKILKVIIAIVVQVCRFSVRCLFFLVYRSNYFGILPNKQGNAISHWINQYPHRAALVLLVPGTIILILLIALA